MMEKDYIITVESFDWKKGGRRISEILQDTIPCSWQYASELMNNLPFTIDVWESQVEIVKNDLEIASATVHVEKRVKETLKNKLGFRNAEQPIAYSTPQNTAVSAETLAIINYLKDVYLLERQLYTYEQISDAYERTYDNLKGEKCVLRKYDEFRGEISKRSDNWIVWTPTEVKKQNSINGFYQWEWVPESWRNELGNLACGGWAEFYIPLLAFLISPIIIGTTTHSFFTGLIVGLPIGLGACLLLQNLNLRKYESDRRNYKQFMTLYEEKYNKDLKAKEVYIDPKIKAVVNEYQESIIPNVNATQKLLNKIYSANIIHPKYRNFVAVAQIYEYFETGRCSELEGPNGAYNLYESELRLNTIIDKLDIIIQKLDALNATMGMVVSAINYSNRMLSDISSSLNRIEANTALTAYNTQCIAFNTELANRY